MSIKEIIEKVAEMNNTTLEEVYAEMQAAINAGFCNPDLHVQEEWEKVSFQGVRPTPEEVILYAVGRLLSGEVHGSCEIVCTC